MFERFTERARKVVVLAQDEAARLRHDYIGTEHLLMGLIREEEGVAAQALRACGATLDGVREQVENIVGFGDEETGSQAPFTQGSKDVLELSLGESLRLGHNYIGTEHILLGLLAEGGGVSTTALSNLGIEPEKIRGETLRRMGGGTRFRSRATPSPLGWARGALQRSFGRYPREEDRASFEKFTERARKVVVLAQDEARHFNHNYIGTEHILLGLIREEDGIAAEVLEALGVHLDEAREQVESIVGYGEEMTGAQAPFTPRVNKVLRIALREAAQLGHDYVSTEHVLLGLVRESEGVAARVLLNLDVDPDVVRREVMRRLAGSGVEYDSLDQVGRSTEEAGWKLFRGKVEGIRAELNLPRPLTVSADADYSYRVSPEFAVGSTSVELGDVADMIRDELLETEARSLEAAAMALGERLMGSFPAMLELGVTISGAPEPANPPASTFSVSTTFRR
ncbi:Clp protease N-terminal domain-containing protein [Rubrobacter tropicus]|uniref:Clp protease N-terminal domain-containing protein n=1 Tax=Rubrobacter tropicus TaxID=2653851 RepID=UPI002B1BD4B9|nr:Clp protease N-terminal domain-containing protein [Rubrobacter tropicus]